MTRDKFQEKKTNVIDTKTRQSINNKKEQEWLKENKEAIYKQNERIEKEGLFSDGYRRF